MKAVILLNYTDDIKKTIEEERFKFLRLFLISLNVPIQTFWKEDDSLLSANQQLRLNDLLSKWNIQVISYDEGSMKIFNDNTMIGEWKAPTYLIKKDNESDNPRKQLYIELTIDHWSFFEEI